MGVVRHESVIDGPRERIFDYINAYQNVPEYMFGVKEFLSLIHISEPTRPY